MAVAVFRTGPPGAAPVIVPPAVVVCWWWRRLSGDVSDGVRVESCIPNGDVLHWKLDSGQGYEFRVEAVGENGVSAFSEWVT